MTDDVSYDIPLINCTFVTSFLPSMDGTKSTGLDCICPRLSKLSLQFCQTVTKHAKVKPLYISGAKDELNNYRPISILPTLSKIISKWVHMKLMSYLNHHHFLNQKQSGFRFGHSTESPLLQMTDTWLHAINDGNIVGCV